MLILIIGDTEEEIRVAQGMHRTDGLLTEVNREGEGVGGGGEGCHKSSGRRTKFLGGLQNVGDEIRVFQIGVEAYGIKSK